MSKFDDSEDNGGYQYEDGESNKTSNYHSNASFKSSKVTNVKRAKKEEGIPQLDGFYDSSSFMETDDEFQIEEDLPIESPIVDDKSQSLQNIEILIPQLDGFNDEDLEDLCNREIRIFGVNCEIEEISQLLNFFRSFNFMWISSNFHKLCCWDQTCYFCYMRSSCIRLRQVREKGPRCLKPNEYTCQLNQYCSILEWNWREGMADMKNFIENTLTLLARCDKRICSYFIKKNHDREFVFKIEFDS